MLRVITMDDNVKFSPAFIATINNARYNKLKGAASNAEDMSTKEKEYSQALIDMFARNGVEYNRALKIIKEWSDINRAFYSNE